MCESYGCGLSEPRPGFELRHEPVVGTCSFRFDPMAALNSFSEHEISLQVWPIRNYWGTFPFISSISWRGYESIGISGIPCGYQKHFAGQTTRVTRKQRHRHPRAYQGASESFIARLSCGFFELVGGTRLVTHKLSLSVCVGVWSRSAEAKACFALKAAGGPR